MSANEEAIDSLAVDIVGPVVGLIWESELLGDAWDGASMDGRRTLQGEILDSVRSTLRSLTDVGKIKRVRRIMAARGVGIAPAKLIAEREAVILSTRGDGETT